MGANAQEEQYQSDHIEPKANPEPPLAYAHPGYEQPAYKRLAKREAPVAKTNDYYDPAAYADPNVQRYGPPPPAIERLAKRDAAAYAQPNDYYAAAGLGGTNGPYGAPPAFAPKLVKPVV